MLLETSAQILGYHLHSILVSPYSSFRWYCQLRMVAVGVLKIICDRYNSISLPQSQASCSEWFMLYSDATETMILPNNS